MGAAKTIYCLSPISALAPREFYNECFNRVRGIDSTVKFRPVDIFEAFKNGACSGVQIAEWLSSRYSPTGSDAVIGHAFGGVIGAYWAVLLGTDQEVRFALSSAPISPRTSVKDKLQKVLEVGQSYGIDQYFYAMEQVVSGTVPSAPKFNLSQAEREATYLRLGLDDLKLATQIICDEDRTCLDIARHSNVKAFYGVNSALVMMDDIGLWPEVATVVVDGGMRDPLRSESLIRWVLGK